MLIQKRLHARKNARVYAFSFGLGVISSLIAAYLIFRYSKENGWEVLAFISKWYLIIAGVIVALPLGILLLIILLIALFSLLMLLIAMLKLRSFGKRYKKQKRKEYVDVEYKIKVQ